MRLSPTDPSRSFLKPSSILAVLVPLLFIAGCATAPTAQLAVSHRAIDDAKAAGAAQSAPLDLQRAEDKLSRGEAAAMAENNEQARRFAEEAEVDARLAAARARAERTRKAAAEVEKSIRALRENPPPAPNMETPSPASSTAPR